MSDLIHSITTIFRRFIVDRRQAARYKALRKVRLLFSISLLDAEAGPKSSSSSSSGAQRLMPLEGYTRDISLTGMALVVPSIRLGGRYLTDKDCKLRIVLLDLPTGQVEIHATPVRYEQLTEKGKGKGHLIGVRIEEMSDSDRLRFENFLRTLP